MSAKRQTELLVFVALVLLLGWEAWTLANSGAGDTISEIVWNATNATPLVPFLVGGLMGHWFFPKGVCVHCGRRPWAK